MAYTWFMFTDMQHLLAVTFGFFGVKETLKLYEEDEESYVTKECRLCFCYSLCTTNTVAGYEIYLV